MKALLKFVLMIAFAGTLAGCQSELYSGLGEREANEMVAVLAAANISAERGGSEDGAFSVSVDGSDIPAATQVLTAHGLPRARYQSLGQVFQGGGMATSPLEERARLMYALSEELSNSISQIAGVASTRVHIILPEVSPFETKPDRPRASVFIYLNQGTDFAGNVPTIKQLIVNAVSGLAYEDVAVALFPISASVSPRGAGQGDLFGMNALWIALSIGGLAGAVYFGTRRRANRRLRML